MTLSAVQQVNKEKSYQPADIVIPDKNGTDPLDSGRTPSAALCFTDNLKFRRQADDIFEKKETDHAAVSPETEFSCILPFVKRYDYCTKYH